MHNLRNRFVMLPTRNIFSLSIKIIFPLSVFIRYLLCVCQALYLVLGDSDKLNQHGHALKELIVHYHSASQIFSHLGTQKKIIMSWSKETRLCVAELDPLYYSKLHQCP